MRIVIVGGGIAAAYLANNIKKRDSSYEVVIVSDEKFPPYDRIHLCCLINDKANVNDIKIPIDPTVSIELNQQIQNIDTKNRKIFSQDSMFSYDKLIIATGSKPVTLFDVDGIKNSAVFRSAHDCEVIKTLSQEKEVVMVGVGPIGIELLETLNNMDEVKNITLLSRGTHLYDKNLSVESIKFIEKSYLKSGKIKISYEDEIVDTIIEENEIKTIKTKKLEIKNPFLVFGVGIKPNIDFFKDSFKTHKGILVNDFMQTSEEDVYAVGECAEVESMKFVAGHVKECTNEADTAIAHIFGEEKPFEKEISIDMLKVKGFELVDVRSPEFNRNFEKVVISSKKDKRIDEYFIENERLVRFIGINSNVDVSYVENLIKTEEKIDVSYLYENRLLSQRGRLVCSCKKTYYQDIVDIVVENGVTSFSELAEFSEAGRVCGRCKKAVDDIIKESHCNIKDLKPKKSQKELLLEKEIENSKKRVEKFKALHPINNLNEENLENALSMVEIGKHEVNSWISMVTANMQLHPNFEEVVEDGIKTLNKVPIIWLELADCSGNSEAFIKSTNPAIEDLIFDYISVDYHELIMSAGGDQSESALEDIIKNEKGKYVLIVEGAIPPTSHNSTTKGIIKCLKKGG